MAVDRLNYPQRKDWRTSRASSFGYRGLCQNCTHDNLDHFWWEGTGDNTGEMQAGCHGCVDKICTNRKVTNTVSALNLCERCDALMLGKAVATLQVQDSPRDYAKTIEICPACIGDFHDFMHSGPTRDNRPFREPYTPPEEAEKPAPKELL